MAGLENDSSNKKTTVDDVHEEANVYEDEINLIDYLLVLWKRKWFIFLASVLPALIVAAVMFLGPRDYKINYTYNVRLDEKAFKVLEDRFYSEENIEKLIGELQKDGFDGYVEQIRKIRDDELEKFVEFEVSPPFVDISNLKTTDPEQIDKLRSLKAFLLNMTITGRPKEDFAKIALVCRKNFEQIIPMYPEKEQLNSKIVNFKGEMAGIEETRYTLNLQLEREKTTLEKLKNSGSDALDKLPSDIILQFNNVGGNNAFLPLPYQIQAAKIQIINLEEQIRANKEKYDYYTGLLKLNETLFSHVEKLIPSYYTLEQFRAFLIDMLAGYKEDQQQLQDYLKAYIKRIENKIANVIPLVEKPGVYSVAKGIVKKSAVVFVIAFMMSAFASFLSEGLRKSQA